MASGWVVLDKDSGVFSRTAGGRVARLFGQKTFGHIGTLDPMASGVLAIAVGDATKMIPFVEDINDADVKEYLFSVQFGFLTDTLDIMGRQTARDDFVPCVADVVGALPKFLGNISQIPPIYSAIHVNGTRAYQMALSGKMPQMQPRPVHIYELEFLGISGHSWNFKTRCSRGTYVRSLGRDIAAMCGAMGTVDMIRREKSGIFDIENAVKLDFLEKLVNNGDNFKDYLKPIDFGLGDIPVLNLDDKAAHLYKNGGFIDVNGADGLRRVYSDDIFIGIGIVFDGVLRPKRTI